MKSIVLLGGTFDPVHNGHVAIAEGAAHIFSPEKMIVLPAGNPYQRARLPFASGADRVAMLVAGIGLGSIKVVIDRRELNRTGPTYTVDTLQELRKELGDEIPLIWLIGSDAFSKLDTWHRWQDLFGLTHFAVVTRPGERQLEATVSASLETAIKHRVATASELNRQPAGSIAYLALMPPEISSTQIRDRCQNGESINGLVPAAVCDYIEQHKLYLNNA